MRARIGTSTSVITAIALSLALVMPSGAAFGSGAAPAGVTTVWRGPGPQTATQKPAWVAPAGRSGVAAEPAAVRSVVDIRITHTASEARAAVDPLAPSVPGEVIVVLDSAVSADSSERALEGLGAEVERMDGDASALVVDVPLGTSAPVFTRIAEEMPGVAWVQPNYIYRTAYHPNDPMLGQQWGITAIHAETAWDTTTGESSVLVAVVDTGVDYNHADLASRVATATGKDFVNGDNDAMDDNGHGTHVAGIVAATANNSKGGAGVAPGARVLPVKVLDRNGSGYTDWVAAGIRFAADAGAKVINLSLAGGADSVMSSAVAYAQTKGCLVVAAAGNDGSSSGASYPARYDGVIGVGAVDSNNARASFSNYGADAGVDIAAPGVGILSTVPGNTYQSWNGTSMAAPFVSGVAALLLSADPSLETNLTALRDAILDTADPAPVAGMAHGLVRADLALAGLVTESGDQDIPGVDLPPSPVTGTLSATTDAHDVYAVYLGEGQTFDAALPPTPGANFDLILYAPGTTSIGSGTGRVAWSYMPTGSNDAIHYDAPDTGLYYLDVKAYEGAGSYELSWSRAGSTDDNIPGLTLTMPAKTGLIDDQTDPYDVYRVDIAAGQQLSLDLAGPTGSDLDLRLYAPGATDIFTDAPVATRESSSKDERLRYHAMAGGTYYVAVYAYAGSGTYTLRSSVDAYNPDDNIPGIVPPGQSLEGTVGGLTDSDDVYKVFLQAGQSLDMTMTNAPPPGPTFYPWLAVYPPTATDVDSGILAWASSDGDGVLSQTYNATSTGYHYIDVYSEGDPVGYTLQWRASTSADDNVPGVTPPNGPVNDSLGVSTDTDDVYRISAQAGQIIEASLTAPSGTDFDLYLFGPGSTSTTNTALAKVDGSIYPKTLASVAPTDGDYYVQAHAFAGEGNYSLVWSVAWPYVQPAPAPAPPAPWATVYRPHAPSKVTRNRRFTVYGYVAPKHRISRIAVLQFFRKNSAGVYVYHHSVRTLRSKTYRSPARSKYTASVKLPHKGRWAVRAVHRDSGVAPVYSGWDYIRVR